jgi:transmembrane sensor
MRLLFGKRRVREEALMWLARLKRGLRQHEGPELLTWLKRRSHRLAIANAAVEWHGPEVLAVLSEIFPIPPAVLEPRGRPHLAFLAVAAIVGGGVTIIPTAIFLWVGMHGQVYSSAPAATKLVALEDGTRVELNHGTEITVVYAAQARSVVVARGEALFKVTRQPNRPFYVHAAGRNFETASATFDVRLADPNTLNLTVLEGAVTVLPPPFLRPPEGDNTQVFDSRVNQPILLEPLQMLVIEQGQEFGQMLSPHEVRSRLAWQSGT